jgi:hypothetical protein
LIRRFAWITSCDFIISSSRYNPDYLEPDLNTGHTRLEVDAKDYGRFVNFDYVHEAVAREEAEEEEEDVDHMMTE